MLNSYNPNKQDQAHDLLIHMEKLFTPTFNSLLYNEYDSFDSYSTFDASEVIITCNKFFSPSNIYDEYTCTIQMQDSTFRGAIDVLQCSHLTDSITHYIFHYTQCILEGS